MRLSRTISSNVNDQSASGEEGGDGLRPTPHVTLPGMTVTGEVKADTDLPAWQSAFILGPNVRFTRTPESAYARKHAEAPEEKQEAVAAAGMEQQQPTTVEAEKAAAPADDPSRADIDGAAMRKIEGAGRVQPAAPAEAGKPVLPSASVAGVVDNHGALALYLRLKREMAEASRQPEQGRSTATMAAAIFPAAANPKAAASVITVSPGPSAPTQQGAFGLHISDHALFDTMCLDVDLAGFAPAPRLAVPTFHIGPETAASLYREVSIRGRHVASTTAATPARAMSASRPAAPAGRTMPERNALPAAPRPFVAVRKTDTSRAPQLASPVPSKAVVDKPAANTQGVPRATGTAVAPVPNPATHTAVPLVKDAAAPGYMPLSALPSLAAFQLGPVWAASSTTTISLGPLSPASTGEAADAQQSVEPNLVAADSAEADRRATAMVPAAPVPAAARAPVASRSLPRSGLFAAADVNPDYEFPPVDLLQQPADEQAHTMTQEALEQSAGLLESILEDFGVKGEIIDVRPGPVVTLYEFEPAPGVKSSRVIGLADDIARSMSALSARVAVVPGRNVIGIELPNAVRETVYFRELIECESYWETKFKLALCLGKTIGGEPVVAELAKMPHLLVAGTTGSGKSVAINTMILSLLYRLKPEECRLIMVDPKMLELSVYDGIPHLLTPVVTDPKKAVMALKWAVREMEDRYRKMSRLGVRNIDGFNARAAAARANGETVMCDVPKGFDRSTGEPTYEQEEMDLTPMPYIVVIVDEMADLMMVAGKEIEGAIQRLAQMARAAGIHLIMATQRPSVDVITGTIKANFPTRISFQVTSKIDSRTILGEQGAEHLLGQGDMLHMVGGGRIARVHGPFVSDAEVEQVVAHLKAQGRPEYLGTVTEDADEEEPDEPEDTAVFDKSAMGEEDGNDLYEKAIKVVMRDRKCSTSYIQRRLSIGYNRAASLVERMERDGLVGPANHVGKREILNGNRESAVPVETVDDED
ncbi:S-DNA-T family DNA segregation ATPase FtsK/SpoIIIE [Rhizobium azooxidifex]|uniref:S-DNA-T family DNA segregation ATPase FtsK/SpoIIIE n=1 Tax=Mycoplana azooxidifex TaxID=1636188 RepID=A0A7W6DEF9_9HYPH|nr:DNA translocase FtsK [Mycoplana azooxidifex]MBB3978283.1 S-DNA-T family DNA segregation ATPase FtsK/SpoIIIE [Mycoplana azooxidifex]